MGKTSSACRPTFATDPEALIICEIVQVLFGMEEVEYLGHNVGHEGVRVDPKKIQAMQDWPQPNTLKSLRGFLGLTSY